MLIAIPSGGQDTFSEDTINISAITVTAPAATRLSPFTVSRIEPEIVSRYKGSDLAAMLQETSMLYVKRYGNHGLSSVSVRGMSGSHTLVTWNGLPLNAPGNGYSDFTIIPVMAFTSVKIISGGSDLEDVAGYIGGKVELASEPEYDTGKMASLSVNAGSYGDLSSSGAICFSGAKTYIRISSWGGKARNNFRFINENAPGGPAPDRRSNASFSSGGIISDLAFRTGLTRVSAHLWYNDSDRELPGPVTTVQQDFGERQTDRSIRGVVKLTSSKGRFSIGLLTGATQDRNIYFNQLPSNNGDNNSATLNARVRLGYNISQKSVVTLFAGEAVEKARALSFEGEKKREILSVSLVARSNPVPALNLLLEVRQMAVTDMKVSPELTAGAVLRLSPRGENLLRASVSHNVKLPNLNDMYWIPGGNPGLIPEKSIGGETSWSYLKTNQQGTKNTLDITFHASRANDMIQWIPGQSGLWNAVNLRTVIITGAEARAATVRNIGIWNLTGCLNYAFTRSVIAGSEIFNDRSVGSQLVYAPLHHANLNLAASSEWFFAGFASAWESRRFTTSDNSEWLQAAFMADASAGAIIPAGKVTIKSEIKLNNIFNIPGESVRNYPMPLRTVNLKLTLTWSEKTNDHENNP
jgi:iron complex outermembrane receptor protein